MSTSSAHCAIARARVLGCLHVGVDGTAALCVELENALIGHFGLAACRVAMDLPDPSPIPLRALRAAGGAWLGQMLDSGAHDVIGMSHGRTIASMIDGLRPQPPRAPASTSMAGRAIWNATSSGWCARRCSRLRPT